MRLILRIVLILGTATLAGVFIQSQDVAKPASRALLELQDGDRIVYYGNTLLERDRHYGMLETMFRSRFPGRKLSFRNLAWPGDTVHVQLRPLNFGSMELHLKAQKPSVILVSFGNNEAYDGQAGLQAYLKAYRRQLEMLARTGAKIVILSPIRHEDLGPPFPNPSAYNENARLYSEATRQLARETGALYIDLYNTLIPQTTAKSATLTENSVHLNRYGYWRLSEVLAEQLGLTLRWQVILDFPKQQLVAAHGTQLQHLNWKADGLSFTARDLILPNPAPEGAPENADHEAAHRRLQISGLPGGTYELLCDGKPIVRASAKEWQQGLVLTADPAYQQVRQLRQKVIEKDLLFFHRWRAHNGEYIYGRRSKPGGGNAGNPTFPSEFAELDRLLTNTDADLDQLASPQTHTYTLRRVKP
jgi:lysophospholipase L1-like esterase